MPSIFRSEVKNPFNSKVHTFFVEAANEADAAKDIRQVLRQVFPVVIFEKHIGPTTKAKRSDIADAEQVRGLGWAWVN